MNVLTKRLNTSTKKPASRLCLVYEFKTSSDCDPASSEAHDAAVKQAARETRIADESSVQARVVECLNPTLEKVHHYPFDPKFHKANGGPSARMEFVYGKSQMFVRIVTSLGDGPKCILDGVSASRLAFHAMEILENQPMTHEPRWSAPVPPLVHGWRQKWNNFREMNIARCLVLLAQLRLLLEIFCGWSPKRNFDKQIIASPYNLFSFYQSDAKDNPAQIHVFSSKEFKTFLAATKSWSDALGSTGFFYLMNFPPKVACGVTRNVYDIKNRHARYQHAFTPAGAGPPPPAFGALLNAFFTRKIVVNNYGIHQHNFSSKAVAFVWDWLEMAAPVHVCGCISINGLFLAFARGLPASLEAAGTLFGNRVRVTAQNTEWFHQMGPWDPNEANV